MSEERRERARRTLRVVAVILGLGWTASAGVWLCTTPTAHEDVDDEIDDMEHSKRYLRELERIGGKSAVFTAELDRWVAGLWQGRNLAWTTAALTAAVAGGYALARGAAAPAADDFAGPARR